MLTRRHFLQFSALTAAGYALAAEPILAQAIRTDTAGLVAGDVSIKSGNNTITAYEARPDKPGRFPVVVVISDANRSSRTSPLRPIMRVGSQRRLPNGSGSPAFAGAAARRFSMPPMTKTSARPRPGMALQGGTIKTTLNRSAASMWRKTSPVPSSASSESKIKTRHRRMCANSRRC
jgi:hypothetical protein